LMASKLVNGNSSRQLKHKCSSPFTKGTSHPPQIFG
jgi:hypothetical protein